MNTTLTLFLLHKRIHRVDNNTFINYQGLLYKYHSAIVFFQQESAGDCQASWVQVPLGCFGRVG